MTHPAAFVTHIPGNRYLNGSALLIPAALLSAFLLAACGSSASSTGASDASPTVAAAASGASSDTYTYSTAPANEVATANSLDASTAAYVNARYNTVYAAMDMQCSPTYSESVADESFTLWSCDYLVSGVYTGIVRITGPHSWQITPSSTGES